MSKSQVFHKNNWTDTDVEKHWDSVAHIYVSENNKVQDAHDQRFTFSIPYLKLQKGLSVLNITSRDGEAAEYLIKAQAGLKIINAEISQGLIDVASAIRPNLEHVKLSTYSELPFADQLFDRILSLETLEHAADPVAFLRELNRVSRPGATMVLSCPPATSEWPYRIYTALFGGHGEGPHRFPPSRQVKQWLAATGWELTHHEGTVLIPVGPSFLKQAGEKLINRMQGTFISELGIRQFYVCNKH
jgi:2-polyprenyl-3-methyl-5-hydroxy-6-metoxy-1,4-benzoquinol methylase